jgi:hypothetical protein
MLKAEVVLRFRDEDGREPLFGGASASAELARVVADELVREASALASRATRQDPTVGAVLRAEVARLRGVRRALEAMEPAS